MTWRFISKLREVLREERLCLLLMLYVSEEEQTDTSQALLDTAASTAFSTVHPCSFRLI